MEPSQKPGLEPTVIIVDDDELVRGSVDSLVRSAGYRSLTYANSSDLLSAPLPEGVRCLVADVRLPMISGLDLPSEFEKRGELVPIIFMTGHGDIPMTVRAMKAGAVDFLPKPFRDQDMLDAIAAALTEDLRRQATSADLAALKSRFDTLTSREREVFVRIAAGLLNKQVAGELRLSEITVKLHRGSAMRKMNARTLPDAVRMVEALERASITVRPEMPYTIV